MRILIIGASGFIGRYVSPRLSDTLAHDVFGSYRSGPVTDSAFTWLPVDLTENSTLEEAFATARPEVVLHLVPSQS